MRCSFNYYYCYYIIILFIFIFLYMYTKLWQYCIIYSHANKAILNWIELDWNWERQRERERERESEWVRERVQMVQWRTAHK